ncbi:unnamed protein product [Clonostachys solani]|uniref:Uncharacterized protein n=1 Tax=Clonostachys solani TaxID=160281 RepID=A0A9P0ES89_9HYPO|nr:unnamed protein product [Clonostachys solani]
MAIGVGDLDLTNYGTIPKYPSTDLSGKGKSESSGCGRVAINAPWLAGQCATMKSTSPIARTRSADTRHYVVDAAKPQDARFGRQKTWCPARLLALDPGRDSKRD